MESLQLGIDMDISKKISIDIIEHLQKKKGMSINEIAEAMSTTPDHISKVIKKKTHITSENIHTYLENKNQKFWEFALESIPMSHIPLQTRRKIQICKDLSNHIKKVRKKFKNT